MHGLSQYCWQWSNYYVMWNCTVILSGKEMPFKVDTGIEVTVISDDLWESLGMSTISQIKELTPWCPGMLVVLEKSGSVCICVDFRPHKDNVLWEVHPLPKVDVTLSQLVEVTIFSKLNKLDNCCFWQISLDETSHHLTTFITAYGWLCFNEHGISSALSKLN